MKIPHFMDLFGLKSLDYVRYGLLQHYDAINNTGSGHSGSATIWKDLIGNNNGTVLGGAVWEDNSIVFDGVDDKVRFTGTITPEYTITATVLPILKGSFPRIFAEGTYPTLYMNPSYSFRFAFFGHGVDTSFSPYTHPDATQKNQLTITFGNNKIKLYVNGVFAAELTGTTAAASVANAYLGGRGTNDRQYAGRIYNYLVYNRVLPDSEILTNFEVDKERFGIS